AVRSFGITLPATDDRDARPLGLAELTLLHRLAQPDLRDAEAIVEEVAAELDADPDLLRELVVALKGRELVVAPEARSTASYVAEPVEVEAGATRGDTPLMALSPTLLLVTADGFVNIDHDRRCRAVLSPVEVQALGVFSEPVTWIAGIRAHRAGCGRRALREREF